MSFEINCKEYNLIDSENILDCINHIQLKHFCLESNMFSNYLIGFLIESHMIHSMNLTDNSCNLEGSFYTSFNLYLTNSWCCKSTRCHCPLISLNKIGKFQQQYRNSHNCLGTWCCLICRKFGWRSLGVRYINIIIFYMRNNLNLCSIINSKKSFKIIEYIL